MGDMMIPLYTAINSTRHARRPDGITSIHPHHLCIVLFHLTIKHEYSLLNFLIPYTAQMIDTSAHVINATFGSIRYDRKRNPIYRMQACRVFDDDEGSYRQPLIPAPKKTRLRHRLFIDSRDTNPNLTNFSFTVDLEAAGAPRFERVENVELKALTFPKTAEPYVIMDVAELNDDRLVSTNAAANQSFAVCYFDAGTVLSVGQLAPMKGVDFYQRDIKFNPLLPKLNRLTVQFKHQDGSVITTSDTNSIDHCSFMLEVTTCLY
jgi:hypothetical protein